MASRARKVLTAFLSHFPLLLVAPGCVTSQFWTSLTRSATYMPETTWLGVASDDERVDFLYFIREDRLHSLRVERDWATRATFENASGRVQLKDLLDVSPVIAPAPGSETRAVHTIWDKPEDPGFRYASFNPGDGDLLVYGAHGGQEDWTLLARIPAGKPRTWEPGPGHYALAVLMTPVTLALDVGTAGLFILFINPEMGAQLAASLAQSAAG